MEGNDDIEANERAEVSGITAVAISDNVPNGDDSAFGEEQTAQTENSENNAIVEVSQPHIHNELSSVFVATSQGIISADQLAQTGIKTTHIVIHDQTMDEPPNENLVESPNSPLNSPLPPPTPATPLSREKGFRYQWDESAFLSVLPVRCKNTSGELHKNKFGSGGRGKCIRAGDKWYTPTEFESVSGRGSSKDWKRSIRYGGRILHCLIEDGILQVHATSCTCAACCDDVTVTGPVRLFQPYKRKKKESVSGVSPLTKKPRPNVPSPLLKDGTSVLQLQKLSPNAGSIQLANTETGEIVQILTTDSSGNIVATTETQACQVVQVGPDDTDQAKANGMNGLAESTLTMTEHDLAEPDVMEQKHWLQLDEMANNLMQQAEQLKMMIEQAKQQSTESRHLALRQLKAHYEKEKHEAVNAMRIEGEMNLSRSVMAERTQKDIELQHAFAQARAEMNENSNPADAGDKVSTYSVTWVQPTSSNNIGTFIDADDSDQEKDKD